MDQWGSFLYLGHIWVMWLEFSFGSLSCIIIVTWCTHVTLKQHFNYNLLKCTMWHKQVKVFKFTIMTSDRTHMTYNSTLCIQKIQNTLVFYKRVDNYSIEAKNEIMCLVVHCKVCQVPSIVNAVIALAVMHAL